VEYALQAGRYQRREGKPETVVEKGVYIKNRPKKNNKTGKRERRVYQKEEGGPFVNKHSGKGRLKDRGKRKATVKAPPPLSLE